jgi:hypothetical protein
LGVVDCAEKRSLFGCLGQESERGERDEEAIGHLPHTQPESDT